VIYSLRSPVDRGDPCGVHDTMSSPSANQTPRTFDSACISNLAGHSCDTNDFDPTSEKPLPDYHDNIRRATTWGWLQHPEPTAFYGWRDPPPVATPMYDLPGNRPDEQQLTLEDLDTYRYHDSSFKFVSRMDTPPNYSVLRRDVPPSFFEREPYTQDQLPGILAVDPLYMLNRNLCSRETCCCMGFMNTLILNEFDFHPSFPSMSVYCQVYRLCHCDAPFAIFVLSSLPPGSLPGRSSLRLFIKHMRKWVNRHPKRWTYLTTHLFPRWFRDGPQPSEREKMNVCVDPELYSWYNPPDVEPFYLPRWFQPEFKGLRPVLPPPRWMIYRNDEEPLPLTHDDGFDEAMDVDEPDEAQVKWDVTLKHDFSDIYNRIEAYLGTCNFLPHVSAFMSVLLARLFAYTVGNTPFNISNILADIVTFASLLNLGQHILSSIKDIVLNFVNTCMPDIPQVSFADLGNIGEHFTLEKIIEHLSTSTTIFNTFVGGIFTIVALIFTKKSPSTTDVGSFVNNLGLLGKGAQGIGYLIDLVSRACTFAVEWCREKITGIPSSVRVSSAYANDVEQWYLDTQALATLDTSDRLKFDSELCTKVAALVQQGLRIQSDYHKLKAPAYILAAFTPHFLTLNRYWERAQASGAMQKHSRQEPLVISLSGASGVGKSTVMLPLCIQLLKAEFTPEQLADDKYLKEIYVRRPENDFWDGYSGQHICMYDDFGQTVDTSAKPNLEFIEIIRTQNIMEYPLHAATLEEKGKLKFTSKVVLTSTNSEVFNIASLTHPAAFYRRFGIAARVTVAPQFATNGRLDTTKVRTITGNAYSTDPYLFTTYDPANHTKVFAKDLNFADFVTLCRDRYVEAQQKHTAHDAFLKLHLANEPAPVVPTAPPLPPAAPQPSTSKAPLLATPQTQPDNSQVWVKVDLTSIARATCSAALEKVYHTTKLDKLIRAYRNYNTAPVPHWAVVYQTLRSVDPLPANTFNTRARWCANAILTPTAFNMDAAPIAFTPAEETLFVDEIITCFKLSNTFESFVDGLAAFTGRNRHFINHLGRLDITMPLHIRLRETWASTKVQLAEWFQTLMDKSIEWIQHPLFGIIAPIAFIGTFYYSLYRLVQPTNTVMDCITLPGCQIYNYSSAVWDLPDSMVASTNVKLTPCTRPCICQSQTGRSLVELAQVANKAKAPSIYTLANTFMELYEEQEFEAGRPLNTEGRSNDSQTRHRQAHRTEGRSNDSQTRSRQTFKTEGRPDRYLIYDTTTHRLADSAGVITSPRDLQTGVTQDTIKYKYKRDTYLLSSFQESPIWIEVNGLMYRFPTVEHAYQALKTPQHATLTTYEAHSDPYLAKKVGARAVPHQDRTHIMYMLLAMRNTDPFYAAMLQNSSPKYLQHEGDAFWGDEGQNTHGKILMHIRDQVPDTTEGTYDTSASDVIDKIVAKSIYHVYVNGVSAMSCTMIKGRVGILPSHIAQVIQPTDAIRIASPYGCSEGYTFPYSAIKIHAWPDQERPKDLVLWEFPTQVHTHIDLTKYLIHAEQIGTFTNATGSLAPLRVSPHVGLHAVQLCATRVEASDGVRHSVCGKQSYYTRQYYAYELPTEPGDCGAPLVLRKLSLPRKLVGFHISGVPGKNIGISASYTFEDWTLHSKAITTTNAISLIAELESQPLVGQIKPEGDFYPIGKFSSPLAMPTKSAIRPTPLQPYYATPTTMPAALRPLKLQGELVDPALLAAKKSGVVCPYIDTTDLQEALHNVLDLHRTQDAPRRVLTMAQAITGFEGDTYRTPMNRKSSAGFPWNREPGVCGKRKWLGVGDNYITDHPALALAVTTRIANATKAIRTSTYWTDTLKDERRPIEKVAAGKTRLFANGPLDYNIAFRMYFLDFIAHCYAGRFANEMAVGVNPHSSEWTLLYHHLTRKGNAVIAGDFSNFDGTLNAQILIGICDLINEWYDDGVTNAIIRRTLFEEIVNSIHVMRDTVYMCTHSQPSGNPATVVLNCLYNSVILRLCWRHIFRDTSLHSMYHFGRLVSLVSYGDDNVLNIHSSVSDYFNQTTITEAMNVYGMNYTDESKTGNSAACRTISEVSFLKRSFVMDGGYCWAPLEASVLHESVLWCKTDEDLEIPELVKQTVEMMVQEWAHYPRDRFDMEVKGLQDAVRTCVPSLVMSWPSWRELRSSIHGLRITDFAYGEKL